MSDFEMVLNFQVTFVHFSELSVNFDADSGSATGNWLAARLPREVHTFEICHDQEDQYLYIIYNIYNINEYDI